MPFSNSGSRRRCVIRWARKGYQRPTPVQTQSIPLVLSGVDLLARAQTGTGKTAAFGLPMIERLLLRGTRRADSRAARAGARADPRAGRSGRAGAGDLRIAAAGARDGHLWRRAHGTAKEGTAAGHRYRGGHAGPAAGPHEARTIDLSAIEILTLDEADRMLDMGFLPPLRK